MGGDQYLHSINVYKNQKDLLSADMHSTDLARSNPGESNAFWLMLIFSLSIAVGGIAGITLEEKKLTDAFIGIYTAISSRTIAEFKREMPFPTGFCWGGVYDDSKTGIGTLAQTNHSDI